MAKRLLMSLLAIISLGVLGASLVVQPAAAADHSMYTKDTIFGPLGEDPAGHMWFNEHGDVVTLCDNDADGQKPILHVADGDPYGPDYYTEVVGGEGKCITRKASMGGKYNLPENHYIGFLICIYPDGYCNAAKWYNDH
jgi:hypothetical protein